jgi:hypothetical protein
VRWIGDGLGAIRAHLANPVNANWHLYASLHAGLVVPIITAMRGMIGDVVGTVRPFALVLIALWLAVMGIEIASGHRTIRRTLRDFLVAAICVGILTSGAGYMQWVGDLFLTILPNSLAAAFGGNQTPMDGLDAVLATALGAALRTYNALPSMSLMSIPLGLGVIVFAVCALAATGFAFAIYECSVVVNVIAVFIGPIFVALASVPTTRRFSAGWLSVLVGGVTAQVLCVAVLLLLLTVEDQTLKQTAANITTGDNTINMLLGLGQCGLLMVLCLTIVKQIPQLAHTIGGGLYHSAASSVVGSVAGPAIAAAGVAGGAIRSSNIPAAVSAYIRPTAPTGPSMSRG